MQTRSQSRSLSIQPAIPQNIKKSKRVNTMVPAEPIAMRTRNQMNRFCTNPTNTLLDGSYPNIDFDEASQAWNMNKKKIGGGCYTYVGEPTVKATFGGRR